MPTFSISASHRRPLATAAAAAGLLFALWFVPSANASPDDADSAGRAASRSAPAAHATEVRTAESTEARHEESFDVVPYLAGGAGLLGAGGLLAFRLARGNHPA